MKSTNDETRKAMSGGHVSAQGQVKQKDASLSHGQMSQSLLQIQHKDTFLSIHQICHDQTQVQLKDLLQAQFLPGSTQLPSEHVSSCLMHSQRRRVCQLKQDSNHGQIEIQPKATGLHDQRKFRDQYEIIPVYASSQMPNQSEQENVLSVQTPRSNFIAIKNLSLPDNFAFCKNHKSSCVKHQEFQSTVPDHFIPPVFTQESLAAGSSFHQLPLMTTLKKPLVSHYNCEVLSSKLMTENRSLQTEVNTVMLSDIDLPVVETRKPEQQKILEITSHEKIRKSGSPEQLLQEQKKEKAYIIHYVRLTEPGREEGPFTDSNGAPDGNSVDDAWETTFHFIASKQDEEEKLMFRSQVKVWHCSLHRKTALSLQAYFLFHLPDLTPLMDTLVCLNLSFNNLLFFPVEVFNIKSLQVLVLRNNPIRKIPNDIQRLKSLKKFTISFNLLSDLPSGLFLLENLQNLDIAYNGIRVIPNDIKNLRKLECLNTEGNQLSALPSGVLNLPLKYLRIENNFIHPLLWNEKVQNQPQKLTHLAALCFSRNNLKERYTDITEDIEKILDDFTVCDCCSGPRYGEGLRLIQIYRNVFKFGRLPFYFYACSSSCLRNFVSQTGA
ncbi:leucine-rich repeat-containing protein 63 isoform X2 [Anas acuta]